MKQHKKGFTLVELLVVVLIIGVLAAIALPMYQKAVLKSRFSALMPIVKAMNDSNEAYYLEHDAYASDPQELPVQGKVEYPTGTELEFGSSTDYAYVLASNPAVRNNYIMYQKHSDNYPGEIHCEADAEDVQAQEVCKSFGPTEDIGETLTSGYLTYVLSGSGNGVARCPQGATCNSEGVITECPSGKTLHDGACADCDIANAVGCSTTSYEPTSCVSGYYVQDGACAAYDYGGDSICTGGGISCGGTGQGLTFGDHARCTNGAVCQRSTFSDEAICSIHGSMCDMSTFKDNATCQDSGGCVASTFTDESSCDGGNCTSWAALYGLTTFTDNATCKGNGNCGGAIFGGNSICTSTFVSATGRELGCSSNYYSSYTSTFKENAVCAGLGCNTANYQGNSCCAVAECTGYHIPKCTTSVENGQTIYTRTNTYWDQE